MQSLEQSQPCPLAVSLVCILQHYLLLPIRKLHRFWHMQMACTFPGQDTVSKTRIEPDTHLTLL